MANPWFKFYGAEYLGDPKIDQLNPLERACWTTLLCLANVSNKEGIIENLKVFTLLTKTGIYPLDSAGEQLGHADDFTDNLGVLEHFESLDMVERIDAFSYKIKNWQKRQETAMTVAERQAKYRENKKSNEEVTERVTKVTLEKNREDKILAANAEEIHIELESPKTKKITKEMQEVFDLFKGNPARFVWGMRVLERKAADVLFKEFGISELRNRYQVSLMYKDEQHCPQVNSPSDFLEKMPKMEKFLNDKKK